MNKRVASAKSRAKYPGKIILWANMTFPKRLSASVRDCPRNFQSKRTGIEKDLKIMNITDCQLSVYQCERQPPFINRDSPRKVSV